jgi:PAS domain S-box-containing protein/putative nucleotidyltransferase with HDIG domain
MRDFSLSLRSKALLLVSVPFAALVGTMAFHATAERQMRLEFAREHLLDAAKLVAAQHNHAIMNAQQLLESLAGSEEGSGTILSEDCQRMLAQRLREDPRIANINLALPDGRVVCSATPMDRPLNIADRPFFHQVLASPGVVIGEAINSRITGKRVLPFLEAVRDASGHVLGVYTVTLDLAGLTREVARAENPEGATLGLIGAKGEILAMQPNVEGWIGKNASNTAFFRAVQARGGEGTFEEPGFDGVPRVYGLVRFAQTAAGPIWLWYGVARDAVVADIDRDYVEAVLAAVGLFLVLSAAIWVGGERLLLRPISVLSAAARRLGQGDASARTKLAHAGGEVGRLAQSFDDMAGALEARNHDVALANRAVKVLSAWNQALFKLRDETALMESMCKTIVDVGGYRGAWVGFARSDERKTVEPVASWGIDPQFVANLGVTWADAPRGRGPAGTAIRRSTAVIMNDYLTNPDAAPWRDDALRHRYNAIISLPLNVNDAVIGALTLYTGVSESFGEQEVALLTELAAALSSGIAAERARAAHARLEASLQRSEERFRAAAEANLDALFILKSMRDGAGNIANFEFVDANDRAARRLGLRKDEVIGKTFFQLLPFHRTARFFGKYVQVVTTNTPLEEEFRFNAPGMRGRWFRQQVVPVGDGLAISLRDITVWKTSGDKLRTAEERLRLALEAAHLGAFSVDFANDTFTLSEEAGPVFGLPKGAGPRSMRALLEAVHPDDREALSNGIARSRAAAQAARREFRVVWPDGTVHWVESYGSVICDEAGKPVRTVGVVADITQRKLDVVALRRANRALKTLSAGNEVLVHATSESELLRDVCRVAVEDGGYGVAWVGFAEHDLAKTVRIVAQYGNDEGYLGSTNITWADTEHGRGPTGAAIRTGTTHVNQNTRTNPKLAPWRDAALARSLLSSIAMPLNGASGTIGALTLYAREVDAFSEEEVRLLQELTADLAFGIATLRTREERDRISDAHERQAAILRKSLEDGIQAIAATVEVRDPYTSGHQKRVAELAAALAKELGLSEDRIHGLHLAGVVHDLGKISIPAEILAKPGKLTPIEYTLIQGHAQAGYEILKDIDFPWPIATIVRQHHERMDGSGYPQGLKGEDILLESRIMAVADVVEAMGSHRPYRPTLGIDVALQEIERGSGTRYDLNVAGACIKLFREGRYVLAV